jgi:hypothetical protein
MSAYVSIREHTSYMLTYAVATLDARHTSAMSAYVSIREHTSATCEINCERNEGLFDKFLGEILDHIDLK